MSKVKIIIVEDENIVARDLQYLLENLGYSASNIASSGEGAIEMAEEVCPDVVLMDIVLKGEMDGIEAAVIIRERFSIPVIYITAYSDKDTLERAKITEPFGYVVKPFQERELFSAIEIALARKEAEYRLEASERRYRSLSQELTETNRRLSLFAQTIRSMKERVCITDKNFEVTFVNDAFLKTYGYSEDEILGKSGQIIYQNKNPEKIIDAIRSSTKRGGWRGELISVKKDGRQFFIELSTSIIKDDAAEIVGYLFILSDITLRKQMEAELLKLQKLESLGLLAGGIAHDFNNILTIILGSITMIKTSIKPEDKVYQLLLKAEKASRRAKDLTQRLWTFSSGGMPVKKVMSIDDIIKESTELALSGSNVEPEFSIPEKLLPVEIDKGQANQAFNNIVLNAKQAMPNGGILKIRAENIKIGKKSALSLKEGNYHYCPVKKKGKGAI